MAYNPNLYSPSFLPNQQPVNGLISVTGIDGARAYPLPPNSSMPLFDESQDILYVKRTDGAGFPTVTAYQFEEIKNETVLQNANFVTREEFDTLLEKIDTLIQAKEEKDAEQPVPTKARR